MIRRVAAVWISLLMTFSMIFIIVDTVPPVRGATITVDDDGPADHSTIQAAVDAANPGDTVNVKNGTYYENIILNKVINLRGEDRITTIIDGGGTGDVVRILSDWVNITDFTITNSGSNNVDAGVDTFFASYSNISNNNISLNNYHGIYMKSSNFNTIGNNVITSNVFHGIEMEGCQYNTVNGNNVSDNVQGEIYLKNSPNNNFHMNKINVMKTYPTSNKGIWISNSDSNTITNNTIVSVVIGIYLYSSSENNLVINNDLSYCGSGISIFDKSHNNLVIKNKIELSASGITTGKSNNTIISDNIISNNGNNGIHLQSSSNTSIYNNIITSNFYRGLKLSWSPGNYIVNNIFIDDGIYLEGDIFLQGDDLFCYNTQIISDNNTVNGKPVYYFKNESGIYIDGIPVGQLIFANCTDVSVNNTQIDNTSIGIHAVYSSNLNINNNTISDSYYGAYFYHTQNNSFTNNSISQNYEDGIYLHSSPSSRIIGNSVFSNRLVGIGLSLSPNSTIIGNNASNNGGGISISHGSNINISQNTVYFNGIGIVLSNSLNNYILNNNISNSNYHGLSLYLTSDTLILNNNISWNERDGISIGSCLNNNISENSLYFNKRYGIYLDYSMNETLLNNNFTNDGIFIRGRVLAQYSSHKIEVNNLVNGKPLYYFKNGSGLNFDGIPIGQLILINYTNVIVENTQITNTDVGIQAVYSDNITMNNLNLSNNIYGIYSMESFFINMTHNTILSNDLDGVFIVVTGNNIIENNIVSFNGNDGIHIRESPNTTLKYNNLSSNERYGIYLGRSSPNVTLIGNNFTNDGILTSLKKSEYDTLTLPDNNLVNNKPIYFYRNQTGLNINGLSVGQLILANCSNGNIKNLQINNTDVGIHLTSYTSYINVSSNNISNNLHGIKSNGWLNNISNNKIELNKDGIYLSGSADTIMNNDVSLNYENGIYLDGMEFKIIGNNISKNTWGIYLGESSFANYIYHNNFINNTNQAYEEHYYYNYWNNGYPSGGNYWSDYRGIDNFRGPDQDIPGSDGIGDTYYTNFSYQIYLLDKFPLMEPYFYPSEDNYKTLIEGWNLISIPLIQTEQNIKKVLDNINGSYDAVQWYNPVDTSDSWKHYKLSKSFGNDLFNINESMGFWIYLTKEGETRFYYNGTQPIGNQTITLHPGWNLVGYPSLTSYNRTIGLNNLTFGTEIDAIQWFDAYTKSWHFMGPDDVFTPGRGYWVHSKVEAGWEVPI